jgi:hypothetical protein
MTVLELTQLTHWTMLNAGVLESTIEGIYTGDLLSYVMGNGEPKQAWITMQTHQNVIAICSLKEFSVLIIVDGNTLDEEALQSARDNDVNVIVSPLPAFETIRKLVQLGF